MLRFPNALEFLIKNQQFLILFKSHTEDGQRIVENKKQTNPFETPNRFIKSNFQF